MARLPHDADDVQTRADMTPMIDCVFLMIVFFVCLDFRTLEAKLPSYLPHDVGGGPSMIEPEQQLEVQIVCDAYGSERPDQRHRGRAILDDHRVHWQVGANVVRDLTELRRELERIASDPSMQVADRKRPGQRRLADCVIAPGRGVVYDDAAHTADVCSAAGFSQLHWGGGLGQRR